MAGRNGIIVTLGMLGGLAGCSHHQNSVPQGQSQEPPRAVGRKEKDEPKIELQGSTCVALAQTSEHSADVAGRTPADQQRLREQARRAYQQALKLDPKNVAALSGLGNLYVTLKDNTRAVETFRKATEVAPQKASAWYELGMCYSRMKEWQPALAALQKSVDLDPENRQCVHAYGFCLARAGQYDASFAVFARVDGEAAAHYNLGRMLLHLKEENLARQHFQQAVNLDKDLAGPNDMLAQMGQAITMGVPSPITPVSYETTTPVEKAAPAPKPATQEKPATLEDDAGKDSGFSKEAAAVLRRVSGNPQ